MGVAAALRTLSFCLQARRQRDVAVYLYLEKIRVSVNRRRGHTVADEAVPEGMTDAGLPARHV